MRQENAHNSNPEHSQFFGNSDNAMSFKEVLVQFARLSQSERQELQTQAANLTAIPKPPPPYPEVTLHPVPPVPVATVAPTTQTQQNSLLHGILTKVNIILLSAAVHESVLYLFIYCMRFYTRRSFDQNLPHNKITITFHAKLKVHFELLLIKKF